MIFGPNGEETRKYSESGYYAAINHETYRHDKNDSFKDSAAKPVTDLIHWILRNNLEPAVLKFNPYEVMSVIRDLAVTKNAWIVLKFGELDKDNLDKSVGNLLRASAICINDNKNMEKVLKALLAAHEKSVTPGFMQFYSVALNAVITLGCTMAMTKDCIYLWRREASDDQEVVANFDAAFKKATEEKK